jgi:hypothetical protein
MTAASSPPEIGKLSQLKADAMMVREQIAAMDPASFATVEELAKFVKDTLTQNVVPMFESTVEAVLDDIGTEVDRLGDEFETYIQESGDQLSEEAARGIVGVFQQGLIVAKMLEEALPKLDDLKRKKAKQAIHTYKSIELAMREFVQSIVIEDEPEDDDESAEPGEAAAGDAEPDEGEAEPDDDQAPAAPGGEG